MLKNLEKYSDDYVSYLQSRSFSTEEKPPDLQHLESPTPPLTPTPEWIKAGSGLSSVVAGFDGLVCATSNKHSGSLYIRMGVSHATPEGSSWTKIICAATRIAVGKDCVVRKTLQGDLHIVNVRGEYDNCSVSTIQNWTPINVHHLREIQQQEANHLSLQAIISDEHLLLDERDRLFIVAPSGVVYGCLEPYSNDYDAQWIKVSSAPPIGNQTPRILRGLYSLLGFRGRNEANNGIFSQVCVGKGVLWCVRADNNDVWQLVLSDFNTSGGETELRTNWSCVSIPAQDERISLLAASKSTVDGIYAVMVKNSNGRGVVVAYSLNRTGSSRVEVGLPSLHDPACLVIALTLHSASGASNAPTPSKAHRADNDICCENGECSFCQRRQEEPSIVSPPGSRMDVEEQGLPFSILGKRPRPESNESLNEYQLSITGAGSSSNFVVEEHRPKRRRVSDRYPRLDTYYDRLLELVKVECFPNVCKLEIWWGIKFGVLVVCLYNHVFLLT